MRFGKKLALQVMEDQTGAPYLSHKPMKEAINRTVRELRLYQARVQGTGQGWQDGTAGASACLSMAPATPAELAELEDRIATLDKQLFALVDEDLARIHAQVRIGEAQLQAQLNAVQSHAMEAGLLIEESQLQRIEKVLPNPPEDRTTLVTKLLELRVRCDPAAAGKELAALSTEYSSLVETASQHAQYLEINVAGFRKLLKRHEKQIPQKFRSRPMPCLGFHKLVTHTSRQLLDLARQMGEVLQDARQRFEEIVPSDQLAQITRTCGQWAELPEMRGLGPECEMVLKIQKQLKDPMNSQLMQVAGLAGPVPGCLYPKPGAPARNAQQPTQARALQQGGHQLGQGMDPNYLPEHLQLQLPADHQQQQQQQGIVYPDLYQGQMEVRACDVWSAYAMQ